MFFDRQNAIQSLINIENINLLEKLIQQINKDIVLSGVGIEIPTKASPMILKHQIVEIVFSLLRTDIQKLTNLLYRIDISERKILDITDLDLKTKAEKIAILILTKEWQKVYFKNKNL